MTCDSFHLGCAIKIKVDTERCKNNSLSITMVSQVSLFFCFDQQARDLRDVTSRQQPSAGLSRSRAMSH